jgi:chorismate synthase
MSGNKIGKMFNVTAFGSSHGIALGAVVDGCPAGLILSESDIQMDLNKRKPGKNKVTSSRAEKDEIKILSGIFEGKTDGTPIVALVFNKNVDSSAYESIRAKPRPGHGDYTWKVKYHNYDYRGGGRGSGRVTIGHVIGGAIAKKILDIFEVKIVSHVIKIGDIKARNMKFEEIEKNIIKNPVRCADPDAAVKMEKLILDVKKKGDSIGGVVETIVMNAPAGLGEPIFDKLDAEIAKILMGIGSVKGVEIGAGFKSSEFLGSKMNDEFYYEDNHIITKTNNSGGILGGISNGMPIIIKMAVKPTPSISKIQKTVNLDLMENQTIKIGGRHDPCICPRITAVAEASVAIILADHLIRGGFIHSSRV